MFNSMRNEVCVEHSLQIVIVDLSSVSCVYIMRYRHRVNDNNKQLFSGTHTHDELRRRKVFAHLLKIVDKKAMRWCCVVHHSRQISLQSIE